MKIIAFKSITGTVEKGENYVYQCVHSNHVLLKFTINGCNQTVMYSKAGRMGLTVKQAQDMLKIVDIELLEVEEINT